MQTFCTYSYARTKALKTLLEHKNFTKALESILVQIIASIVDRLWSAKMLLTIYNNTM